MVEFGRVHGIVERRDGTQGGAARLLLTVTLETGDALIVVRRDVLEAVRSIDGWADLAWHADQWTQETIGVELAEQGWEALGVSDIVPDTASPAAESPVYAVRRLFKPPLEADSAVERP